MNNSKVLLVEDSHALAKVYIEYLKDLPVDVTHVTEGRAGLDHIVGEDPDIILLDLNLPDINGIELMSELEQLKQDPAIIVITAHGSVDMAVEAMRAGALDFLQKPFDAERLRVTVQNALEKQNLSNLVKQYESSFERKGFHGSWALQFRCRLFTGLLRARLPAGLLYSSPVKAAPVKKSALRQSTMRACAGRSLLSRLTVPLFRVN